MTNTTPLWPAEFPVAYDHARDVVDGSYDVPFDPETPPVIIDIGANIGAFVRFCSRRWPGGVVHCYEPHPHNFQMLKRTCAGMRTVTTVLRNIAVSDYNGRVEMKNFGFNCGEWTITEMEGAANDTLSSKVDVMSALELPTGDILKIDAEGSEVQILGKLGARLKEFSAVMLEIHNDEWIRGIKAMLAIQGFLPIAEVVKSKNRVEMKFLKRELATKIVQTSVTNAAFAISVPASGKRRVLIATSAKGGIPSYFENEKDKLLRLNHTDYHFDFIAEDGYSILCLTRNVFADLAIKQGYDVLVQIDNDHIWTMELLLRLLSHKEPIIQGAYCKKVTGPVKWLGVMKPGVVVRDDGLVECDFLGTGVLRTDVSALKTMVEKLPERAFLSDEEDTGSVKEMTELFPVGVVGPNTAAGKLARIRKVFKDAAGHSAAEDWGPMLNAIEDVLDDPTRNTGRMLGEDYGFSILARKCGLSLFIDTKAIFPHVGNTTFPITADRVSIPQGIPTHSLGAMEGWV